MRVLVAEDDHISRQVILLNLKRLNIDVRIATDGEAVIEIPKKSVLI